MFEFRDPLYLILFLTVPALIFWHLKGKRKSTRLKYSDVNLVKSLGKTIKQRLSPILLLLRIILVQMMVILIPN